MEKIFAMIVAAQLTAAVMENIQDDLPLDPELKDPNLRAANLETWEVFRVFYSAVVKALDNDKDWPAPKISAAGLVTSAAQGLGPVIQGLLPVLADLVSGLNIGGVPVGQIAKRLLDLVPKDLPKVPVPTNLPNPG